MIMQPWITWYLIRYVIYTYIEPYTHAYIPSLPDLTLPYTRIEQNRIHYIAMHRITWHRLHRFKQLTFECGYTQTYCPSGDLTCLSDWFVQARGLWVIYPMLICYIANIHLWHYSKGTCEPFPPTCERYGGWFSPHRTTNQTGRFIYDSCIYIYI